MNLENAELVCSATFANRLLHPQKCDIWGRFHSTKVKGIQDEYTIFESGTARQLQHFLNS